MKVCHVLNMAQDAYNLCTSLRKIGVDADLIIDEADFGMGLPVWEETEVNMDPYKMDFKESIERFPLPFWVYTWKTSWLPHKVKELYRMVEKYDLLHCHASSIIFTQFAHKPHVIHEAGLIRRIHNERPSSKLSLSAYRNADAVIWTNPDTYDMVRCTVSEKKMHFIPFAIDPERYRPKGIRTASYELRFLHPTRHVWDVKGNDRLLNAFAKFLQEGNRAHLTMMDWGYEEDIQSAKALVKEHGIEENVTWMNPVSKPILIKLLNECDAAFDQFLLGSTGTFGLEAMACGTPLCMHLGEYHDRFYGEKAPIAEARTEEQIHYQMTQLKDPDYRMKLCQLGRDYVMRHCNPIKVATRTKAVYEEVLS